MEARRGYFGVGEGRIGGRFGLREDGINGGDMHCILTPSLPSFSTALQRQVKNCVLSAQLNIFVSVQKISMSLSLQTNLYRPKQNNLWLPSSACQLTHRYGGMASQCCPCFANVSQDWVLVVLISRLGIQYIGSRPLNTINLSPPGPLRSFPKPSREAIVASF